MIGSGISQPAEVGNVWAGTLLHVGRQSVWQAALSFVHCTSSQAEAYWWGFKNNNPPKREGEFACEYISPYFFSIK